MLIWKWHRFFSSNRKGVGVRHFVWTISWRCSYYNKRRPCNLISWPSITLKRKTRLPIYFDGEPSLKYLLFSSGCRLSRSRQSFMVFWDACPNPKSIPTQSKLCWNLLIFHDILRNCHNPDCYAGCRVNTLFPVCFQAFFFNRLKSIKFAL